jgi:stage II sporulation protein D
MKHFTIFFSVIFFLFIPLSAYGDTEVTIRVGLVSNVNKVSFSVVEGEYILTDASTQMPIGYPQKGEEWTVLREGFNMKISINGMNIETPYLGPLVLMPQSTSKDNIFRCLSVSYRDSLIIQNDTNGLLAINNVGIEKYLYGVVGKEMGYSAPQEALKAQAVVSRSYALSNKGKSTKYDVGIDTSSQVYGGYDAELLAGADIVKQAVEETAGLVLYYDGKLVNAFYHANAGGHTENSENVWLERLPYIRAVSSPFDQYAVTYPYQTSSGWPANTYEWNVTYSRENLIDKINNWNNRSSNKIEVGELLDLKLSKKQDDLNSDTLSGRVTRLDFIGTKGEKAIIKDSIRSVLGLKSTLFDLLLDSTVYILNEYGEMVEVTRGDKLYAIGNNNSLSPLNGENSNEYTVVGLGSTKIYPKLFNKVIINGKGHGHGLGMSQWGAQGMAKVGYKYDEILEYYYNQGKNNGYLSIEHYRN